MFLNIKVSAKSNKIELRKVVWKEEQTVWDVMSSLHRNKNEKDKSLKRMSDKFQIISDCYFGIKFCFKCEIFFQKQPPEVFCAKRCS